MSDSRRISPMRERLMRSERAALGPAAESTATRSLRGARPLRGGTGRSYSSAFDPLEIRVAEDVCHDLKVASKKEWLITNGMGGYAMSTVVGLNTRRYHGLLVASTRTGSGRAVVLSKMEETVIVPGASRSLDTNFYPGVVHPNGFEQIESFSLYPFPTTTFAGNRWRLEKRIDLVNGENTVVVSYQMLPGAPARSARANRASDAKGRGRTLPPLESLKLRIRPLFAFRDVHALSEKNDRIQQNIGMRSFETDGSIMRCTPYLDWEPVYLVCREGRFEESPDWYRRVEYPHERYRGFDFQEDLWSYGCYNFELRVGETVSVVCTMHAPETHGSNWSEEREVERRVQVMASAPDESTFARRLALAADQFLVRRERDVSSVMAGYPWLTDHVRDTMIALPGLTLVTHRFREAKSILRAYAHALERGLLPNRFPDSTARAEYGSVDSTLWFFYAIFKYLQYTGDYDFVKTELRIPLLETMRYLEEGTRYGIRVDQDGLLTCGEPGTALTWMDTRLDNQPITSRIGKPVEVNALWYNALKLMENLAQRFSIPNDMARFARRAEKVEENFVTAFWNEKRGCLYDVVGASGPDDSVRPNQILVVSLPCSLLDKEKSASVLRVVKERLLTPLGLRTLEPGHLDYQGTHEGDQAQRVRAHHQGSPWSWLVGPYISALIKVRGSVARAEAKRLLKDFDNHLHEDCLGQISQLTWGDPPHWPRGCPAQAAAVAEVLRCYFEDVLARSPADVKPPPTKLRTVT